MKLHKFYSPTCGPCRIQDTYLSELGIDIIDINKVDVTLADWIARHYDVLQVPTLMYIDDQGQEVKRLSGITTKEELRIWLQS